MKPRRKIIVHHEHPAIPDRRFDWSAWHDGDEENHVGYGPSPAEALKDLARLDQERAELEMILSEFEP